MSYETESIEYSATGKFSPIIIDYISGSGSLKDYYCHPVSIEGVAAAIEERKNFPTNRKLLVDELKIQYKDCQDSGKVNRNIELLLQENTFTICTAHQPNIFTGHLYFIYKIIHTIRVAQMLQKHFTTNSFVPVFYMGSEDADLEELGHIFLYGQKYEWETKQSGAVGRMIVDEALIKLVEVINGQLGVLEHGPELIELLRKSYCLGSTIEWATFNLVHALFERYGLVILLPDNQAFKKVMTPLFEDDMHNNIPYQIVSHTTASLSGNYKIQANAREINLFYLNDGKRDRIEKDNEGFKLNGGDKRFLISEMESELSTHPENFSPNVILRGLLQETILPNVAFIGGGGEIAYWLELKDLFLHYKIPFPTLILRNSFIYIEKEVAKLMQKTGLNPSDVLKEPGVLFKEFIYKNSTIKLSLMEEKNKMEKVFEEIGNAVVSLDSSLTDHVASLKTKAIKKIEGVEDKMVRSQKEKFSAAERQINNIRSTLFPSGNFQERMDNFMPFYARYGQDFIEEIYNSSGSLEQKMIIITKK